MSQINVETVHNVRINYVPARTGDRMIAELLDFFVLGAYFLIMSRISHNPIGGEATLISNYIVFMPMMFYHLIMEYFFDGQTLGKMAMKLQVIKTDGSEPGFVHFFIRWVFRLLEIFATFGSVALLTTIINGKGQRLGDLTAGTALVSREKTSGFLDQIDSDKDHQLTYESVSELTEKEIALIRKALYHYNYSDSHPMLQELNYHIMQKLKETNGTTPPRENLETILKDYNFKKYEA